MAEIKKVVETKENAFDVRKYPHLRGIVEGDILEIKNYDPKVKYPEELRWVKGFCTRADELFRWRMNDGGTIEIGLDEDLPAHRMKSARENGYTGDFAKPVSVFVPIELFGFRDKEPESEDADKPKLKNYSIHHAKQDKAIINEMISKIDRDRFRKLCSIAMGNGRQPTDEGMDIVLRKWAEAKYDYYVAFGHKLVISTPIEYSMDENEMRPLVFDLYKTWPQYAASVDKVVESGGIESFTKNEMPRCDFFKEYAGGIYKKGMKISKFFAQLFKNEKFDIDFSKVMQNRMIKGSVCISIDPYDFFTSATNMHGWTSCQRLDCSMSYGAIQWAFDPNALIAYRDNGKTYTYDRVIANFNRERVTSTFGKNAFQGNSKSWRQIINGDRKNCAFLFGREYPQHKDIEVVSEKARELLENTIGSYIGVTDWDNYGDLKNINREKYFGAKPVYADATKNFYSDIGNWESLVRDYPEIKKALIAPHDTDMSKVQVTAGGKLYCLRCGKEIKNNEVFDGCC